MAAYHAAGNSVSRNCRTRKSLLQIFGLVAQRPSWAGHVAIILESLCPVGGTNASFFDAATLGEAVQLLLTSEEARKSLVRLSLTASETGVNSNGGAKLIYEADGAKRHVHFVHKMAISLAQPGAENGFGPDRRLLAPVTREMTFHQSFFRELARECELTARHRAPPEGDGPEYDAEEARQRRYEKLGVRQGSRFLNLGVDAHFVWPKEELLIRFDRYSLVLMPATKDNAQSIHIDLHANRLNDDEAVTVINRFLSIMAWCDDQGASCLFGWSGNPVPVEVSRPSLGSSVTSPYIFDRKISASEEARRALALYREARTVQQSGFISYAGLNYYKIIELRHPNNPKRWFRENFPPFDTDGDDLKMFNNLRGDTPPEDYIHKSCRIAVAHASPDSKSDPDEVDELQRLHLAADIMRMLARRFVEKEFAISDVMFSGD